MAYIGVGYIVMAYLGVVSIVMACGIANYLLLVELRRPRNCLCSTSALFTTNCATAYSSQDCRLRIKGAERPGTCGLYSYNLNGYGWLNALRACYFQQVLAPNECRS